MSSFHHHTPFPNFTTTMASCTTTPPSSSLFLSTHTTSSIIINSQDLSSSNRSFPLSRTFFLSPLVLKPANSFHLTYQSRVSNSFVSAVAAGVAETVDEDERDGAEVPINTVTAIPTKPKTGKAALPLKTDRVPSNSSPFLS